MIRTGDSATGEHEEAKGEVFVVGVEAGTFGTRLGWFDPRVMMMMMMIKGGTIGEGEGGRRGTESL